MATEYYYFVTGLPALHLEDTKLLMTPLMFLQSAEEHLNKDDYDLLKLLVFPNDLINLVNILLKEEDWIDENTISREEWIILIDNIKELKEQSNLRKKHIDDHVLPLVIDYLMHYFKENEVKTKQELLTDLFSIFYNWVEHHENKFVREWFTFDAAMRNIITALNCRKHNLDVNAKLIGNNELTEKLKTSKVADFGLNSEFPWFDTLTRLTELTDIVEKEKGYDALRWQWLDDRTFFEYFTIPRIMAYYIKLEIIYRWIHLSQSVGEKKFNQIINDLEASFSFPEEFAINKR
ncbi:MAG TPA: DUF2764 family protein [Candidatus Cloacimonadota bacterium]|nr:DUF2764 family protein [Candidatus Cloacimonadota bacterium]HQL14132.1 DUF2764 family protein [Candidatus Cloacimonadota bacterium]